MPSPEHDEVAALLRAMRPSSPPPVEEARAALDVLGDLIAKDPDVVVTRVELGGVTVERHEPPGGDPGSAIVYLHGGAYTRGSARSHRSLVGRLARASGVPAVAVEYRLAPEHPHPAAVDDAVAVTRALRASDVAPSRLVLAGDSAGGGLAVATMLALRAAGDPLPAGAVLLSPWTDLTLSGDTVRTKAAADPMLFEASLAASAARYAGDDLAAPLVSPMFADVADLAVLPPMLILVGTAEVLLDDATRFAELATTAGVDVDLDVEDHLVHVWPLHAGVPEADAAVARIGAWVRALLRETAT